MMKEQAPLGWLVAAIESGPPPLHVVATHLTTTHAGAASLAVVVPVLLGGFTETVRHAKLCGRYFWIGALFTAGVNLTLSSAFIYTSAANALVLFSLQPLWAAVSGTRWGGGGGGWGGNG
jgi:drug/metabolite transporter (DMT)-like permease